VSPRRRAAGPLRGRPTGSYQGVALIEVAPMVVAAAVPGGVVVGPPTEVATAIDLAHKRIAPVGPGAPLAFALQPRPEAADLLAAVAPAALGDPMVAALVQQFGVSGATLTFRRDGLLTLRIEGDGSKLGAIREIARATGTMFVEQIARQKARAERRHDVAEAVGAIIGHSVAQRTLREIEPRLEGNTLVSTYRLPQLDAASTFLGWTGMAAAIAIPSFQKYVKRAKTSEARMNLNLLKVALRQYAEDHRKDGKRFAFPPATPWSPVVPCCKQPSAPKCRPGLGAFSDPTWKALRFDLTAPFYYQYRVTSEGKGKKARFVVEARGDLDCNGTSSSFRIAGHLDDKGDVVVGELEVKDETE
jgi:type II secretory pathway pseudopilin PulG